MSRANGFTDTEKDLIRQLYPKGGADACLPFLPGKKREAIRYTAHRLKVISEEGRQMKARMERKPEAQYSPSNEFERRKQAEIERLCRTAKEWGAITRTGQLRPIVTVELEAA